MAARIEADLVVVAVGIRPNTALARKAGVDINRGIVVDDRLETSVPGIMPSANAPSIAAMLRPGRARL